MEHPNLNLWIGNALSASAIGGALLGLLPSMAAAIALIWYMIQIYESATVQDWIKARRTRKLARMKAAVIMMQAKLEHPITPIDLSVQAGRSETPGPTDQS